MVNNSYAGAMLVACGQGHMIPPERKTVSSINEMVGMAVPHLEEKHEQIEYLDVIRAMEKGWFQVMLDNLEIIDKYLCAFATPKSQPSVQLKQLLIEHGMECPCKFCKEHGQLIGCQRDLDHWSEYAKQLKKEHDGRTPGGSDMNYLIEHIDKFALLCPCQLAHRLKDSNSINLVAAGIVEVTELGKSDLYSLQDIINIQFLHALDERFGKQAFRDLPFMSMEVKAAKDFHHSTEERDLAVYYGNDADFAVSYSYHNLAQLSYLAFLTIKLLNICSLSIKCAWKRLNS